MIGFPINTNIPMTRQMSYRIPSEDEVAKAIENVLVRTPHMRSQRELCDAVSAELMCLDTDYRIGPERIRRIGISRQLFKLEIKYADKGRPAGKWCPVCGSILLSVRNRTLDGKTVELMRRCKVCGYSAKGNCSKPARYVIERRV